MDAAAAERAARVIAFYLPQFHPVPENDGWWGPGFTEWTNVANARRLFHGHRQPRIPAHLGFYDLRVPETRAAQAQLAHEHGVEAFCYWHYWFAGRRILERPFDEVLRSGEPDFPFCLGWANGSWTGIWHGNPGRVLIEQTYPGLDDHRAHFDILIEAFTDRRYVTVDGRPLLFLFRPRLIPDLARVIDVWRQRADHAGLPGLFIVGQQDEASWVPTDHGCDAYTASFLPPLRPTRPRLRWAQRVVLRRPTIYDYPAIRHRFVPERPGLDFLPSILPNWDNTPRSGRGGLVLRGTTPELFEEQVRAILATIADRPIDRRILFLKSWNEWAEGNYVEPDLEHSLGFLEALRRVIEPARGFR